MNLQLLKNFKLKTITQNGCDQVKVVVQVREKAVPIREMANTKQVRLHIHLFPLALSLSRCAFYAND